MITNFRFLIVIQRYDTAQGPGKATEGYGRIPVDSGGYGRIRKGTGTFCQKRPLKPNTFFFITYFKTILLCFN